MIQNVIILNWNLNGAETFNKRELLYKAQFMLTLRYE